MRVLLIDVNCKNSSTGKIVYVLYNKLREDGHEVAIAYGRGEKIEQDNIYKFGVDLETNIHAALARVTGLNGYFSPLSTHRLLKFIEQYNPDIIHIHELHAYFVNLKPLIQFVKKRGTNIIWTFHCEYMYTGKCGYVYDCNQWRRECRQCPAIREYPKSLWIDRTRTMFNMKRALLQDLEMIVVCPSQWLAKHVRQSFLKGKRVEVIHNGIDTETIFYPRETNDLCKKFGLEDKKIILAVAPNIMDERKGGAHILEVSKRFGDDVVFVMIGAEETVWHSSNILMIRRTKNQHELAQWYSLANIFLICSKKENFPTTCLEALSCGTPVVGFDAGGTKETAPNELGIFVEYMDYSGLEAAINSLLNTSVNRTTIREKAVSMYAKDVMCQNYIRLYESMAQEEKM